MNKTALLVVDEEVDSRPLYKAEFQEEGYEVTVAETNKEAMEKIHENKSDLCNLLAC